MSDKTAEQQFAEALAAFQKSMPAVEKQATGQAGQRQTKYADLAHITEKAFPALADNGLAFTACPTMADGRFVLRYALTHIGGHRESGDYPLPDSANSQQIGSAITYARRYSLLAVTGIAPKDDDDDGASGSEVTTHVSQRPAEPERTTDPEWLEDWRKRLLLATTQAEIAALDAEARQKYGHYQLAREDVPLLEREIAERRAELTGVPA